MLRAAGMLTAIVLACCSRAEAEPGWVVSLELPPDECLSNQVVSVSFRALAADFGAYQGVCVQVRGFSSGRVLYRDRRPSKERTFDGAASDLAQGRLGLYGPDEVFAQLPRGRPKPVEVVGRIGDCADFTFMAGYCHDVDGAYLIARDIRRLDGRPR